MAAPTEENMESENCHEETCEIEATVVTGFETQAKEEVFEKLNIVAIPSRGKINFDVPVSKCKNVLELRSIDNAVVIIKHFRNFVYADDVESTLQQFRDIVPQLDWELGLKVWSQFFSFHHPISAHPAPPPTEVDTASPPAGDDNMELSHQGEAPDSGPMVSPPSEDKSNGDHVDVDKESTEECAEKDEAKQSDGEEPTPKKSRQTDWIPSMPAFRATCYRNGKHVFQSPQVASSFGGQVQSHFGWNVSMKDFDIEVILTIDKDHVYASLALTKESLHRRNIVKFGRTTLRPTIAYNMLRFCHIKNAEVVCDPMCGGGSIPVEAALNWPNAVHICGDIYEFASPKTQDNINFVNTKRIAAGLKNVSASVFKWNACRLPLKDESVDVFITDMPFGKRSGSKLSNWHLYPRLLMEMARVCKRDTGRTCLLTQDKRCLVKSLVPIESLWRRGPTMAINIGGLAAAVFLLHRTTRKYMTPEELTEDRLLRDEHLQKQQELKEQQRQQLKEQQLEKPLQQGTEDS